MDILKKFKALNLHSETNEEGDNEKTPFVVSARLKLDDKTHLLGCSFNPYLDPNEEQILACVGASYLHLFSLPKSSNVMTPLGACELSAKGEDLFTVTWCYDTYEHLKGNNPYKMVTGGLSGQIYIIDACTRELCNRMQFAGGSINDLRTCPTDSNLVACGSKDGTIRIFHIRNQDSLITMGGLDGHVDQVLSMDWAGTGEYIVSCGFDHQIMKWDLTTDHVKKHLAAACKVLESGEINVLDQTTPLPDFDEAAEPAKLEQPTSVKLENYQQNAEDVKVIKNITSFMRKPPGCFLPIYYPSAICSDMHVDYVDCVRMLGTGNYIFSKACGRESSISLWRFGPPKGVVEKEQIPGVISTSVTRLANTFVPNGEAWFTKFEIDPSNTWLACGGTRGTLNVYNLQKPNEKPVISLSLSGDVIRQPSFSSDGRIMVVVGEGGIIVRLDRVPASVDPKDFAKLIR